jgi:hypothetical protein
LNGDTIIHAPHTNMPAANRSGGRDVHIYDAKNPETVIGGLILTNGITNANLYSMVDILIVTLGPLELLYELRLGGEGGIMVERDNINPLQPGNYYICASSTLLSRFILGRS